MLHSRLEVQEIENSSVALFDLVGISLIRCGCLCLAEQCCKEFTYSKSSKHCVGLQFEEFNSTGDTFFITPGNDGVSSYRKGCDTGWLEFKGHCYHKGQTKVNWTEAKTECRKMCSYRVEIESQEESEWISSTFLEYEDCHKNIYLYCTAWMGLNDIDEDGIYMWDHSNAPLNFSNWDSYEPSLRDPISAQSKDCIDIIRGGVWNDRHCYYLNWVVCEKSF